MRKNLNFIVLSGLFFGLGFVTCLNDLLTPILKNLFLLSYYQANFVALAFFTAYFIGGLFYFLSSLIGIKFFVHLGYKGLIVLGLILAGIGCLFFIPAALYKSYIIFLVGLFSIGFGFAFLQISINPLALISGSEQTAASRLNLAQGFNSLATALAPIVGVYVFYKLLDVNNNHSNLKYPYIFFFLFFIAFALLIIKCLKTDEVKITSHEASKPYALNHANLIFGALAIFFYVGSEVSIGTNFISYLKSSESLSLGDNIAGKLLTFYWGGAMIGRFLGGVALSNLTKFRKLIYMIIIAVILTFLILQITGIKRLNLSYYVCFQALAIILFTVSNNSRINLLLFALVNIINLVIGASIHNSWFAIWAILSMGIFNSVMFPNIFDLAIDGLGKYKEQGSSILVMMILGGAIMPIIQGHFADVSNIVSSYYVPIIGYVYIFLYAVFYSKKTYQLIKNT
jgi:FHS family L-fucose permease-like MFS transporter